jgi:hypothetical protein
MSLKFVPFARAALGAVARWAPASAAAAALCLLALPARADKIENPVAVFDGLDKITGRIITFEVSLNETVQFGTLQVTPRVCYSRPPTDPPRTDAFTQVDEIDEQHKFKRIFSGWMFADSPGLHGIEHPIYDVWLVDCKGGTTVIHEAPPPAATASTDTDNPDAATDANATASPEVAPPPAQPKKRPKPKPAVAATPLPAPGDGNAPLDLGGGTLGNARAR